MECSHHLLLDIIEGQVKASLYSISALNLALLIIVIVILLFEWFLAWVGSLFEFLSPIKFDIF